MGKLIQEGDFEVEGMTFHYRYYRDGRLSSGGYDCYLECYYGTEIREHDQGHGLQFAVSLAKTEIRIRKQNAEKLEKRANE